MRVECREGFRELGSNENEGRRESVKSDYKRAKLPSTLMRNLSTFKIADRAREWLRVHETFRPNESESLNSC